MAMNKNMLAALAKPGGGPPQGGQKPGRGKPQKPPPPPKKDEEDDFADGEGGAEGGDAEGGGDEDVLAKYGPLVELLKHAAEHVEEQYDVLDPDMLTDLDTPMDDGEASVVLRTMDLYDDNLANAMEEHLPGMTKEDAETIAAHLVDEGMASDEELMAGYLFRLGQALEGDANSGGGDGNMPPNAPAGDESDSDYV